MEKKGEILNQLAIISDLLENINTESLFTTVTFIVEEKEFKNIYEKVIKKSKVGSTNIGQMFSVKIGSIDFVFSLNKSSV